MSSTTTGYRLSRANFAEIGRLLREVAGIRLPPGKESLVQARLSKRIRALALDGFDAYLARVAADRSGAERALLVDLLTTNKTHFFREPQHFDFLREHVLPRLAAAHAPRFWSAGCSSGEEPYTLAMLLHDELPERQWREARILATDISARVLERARAGVYTAAQLADVPPAQLQRHFARAPEPAGAWRVHEHLRAPIRFARLNLMETWPMRGPFDVIFCRNVMIYFERATQERLVNRYWELLAPGGHLFVGHSESLSSLAHRFRYVQPAVYVK